MTRTEVILAAVAAVVLALLAVVSCASMGRPHAGPRGIPAAHVRDMGADDTKRQGIGTAVWIPRSS